MNIYYFAGRKFRLGEADLSTAAPLYEILEDHEVFVGKIFTTGQIGIRRQIEEMVSTPLPQNLLIGFRYAVLDGQIHRKCTCCPNSVYLPIYTHYKHSNGYISTKNPVETVLYYVEDALRHPRSPERTFEFIAERMIIDGGVIGTMQACIMARIHVRLNHNAYDPAYTEYLERMVGNLV